MLDVEFLVDRVPPHLSLQPFDCVILLSLPCKISDEIFTDSLIGDNSYMLFSCSCQESLFVFGSDSLIVICLGLVFLLLLPGVNWRFSDLYIYVSSNLRGFQTLILQIISLPCFFLLFGISTMCIFICLLMLCMSLRVCSLFPILSLFALQMK